MLTPGKFNSENYRYLNENLLRNTGKKYVMINKNTYHRVVRLFLMANFIKSAVVFRFNSCIILYL